MMSANLIIGQCVIMMIAHVCGQHLPSLIDPDVGLGSAEFIASRGFISEFHPVYSNDGYQTSMHRIVNPYRQPNRQPVLLATIDGGTGIQWTRNSPGGLVNETTDLMGPNLGFELARRGYDVWLLNYRGNPDYCYWNAKYNEDHDLEYWDFSLDEMALFDLPAAIDYIRRVTGYNKIAMVGLSTSNTMYFFLASKVKRFNDIVQPFIAVSPVFFLSHEKGVNKQMVQTSIDASKIRRGQFYPGSILRSIQNSPLVSRDRISQSFICNPLLYAVVLLAFSGMPGSIHYDRLYVYATVGSAFYKSSWTVAQEMSFSLSGDRITMFNVSADANIRRYGTISPPEYLPEMITNPEMHFISSTTDGYADPDDVNHLIQRLGSSLRSHHVIKIPFSAMSFQDGMPQDVIKYVNTPILQILDRYS